MKKRLGSFFCCGVSFTAISGSTVMNWRGSQGLGILGGSWRAGCSTLLPQLITQTFSFHRGATCSGLTHLFVLVLLNLKILHRIGVRGPEIRPFKYQSFSESTKIFWEKPVYIITTFLCTYRVSHETWQLVNRLKNVFFHNLL